MYVSVCVYSTCDILYLYVIIPPGRGATRGFKHVTSSSGFVGVVYGLFTGYLGFLGPLPQFKSDFILKAYLGCNVRFRFSVIFDMMLNCIPVVAHKAVAEVSKIGNL